MNAQILAIEQSTAPTADPVTLAEVKNFCRIDEDRDDALLADLITTAIRDIENRVGRQLITATWKLYLGDFPSDGPIRLPRPPLRSISTITYVDTNGTTQTEAAAVYAAAVDIKSEPGTVRPAYGQVWSSHRCGAQDRVIVTYSAGYGDTAASVPDDLRLAIMLLVRAWYDQEPEPKAVASLVQSRVSGWIW